ncbi:DinB family protein [Paenibacillus hamazuiensis]|uniref:DinB family protein n=1 Tax=Paenibacillus hamazuiensis TaxID=2936508 RepID=UPI00200E4234|nr:DinB family protein [Paenibacillus hamazuiensis]
MNDALLETWRIHQRIHLFMLEAIDEEQLKASWEKGRSVGEHLHHIVKVRRMWLKQAAPEWLGEPKDDDSKVSVTKAALQTALADSADRIERLLELGLETGRIKGFRPHPTAFLGYLIAHEAHHRGQIALLLRQAGVPLDKKTAYGMWEWGVR